MGAETCSASRSMFWLCLGTRVTLCPSSLNRSRSALCTSSLLCPVFSIRPHICTRYSVQSCLPVQIIRHIVLILAAIALWRVCPFVCVRLRICVKVCADMFVSVGARVLRGRADRVKVQNETLCRLIKRDCLLMSLTSSTCFWGLLLGTTVGTVFTSGDRTWGLECPTGHWPAPLPTSHPLLLVVGTLAANFLQLML